MFEVPNPYAIAGADSVDDVRVDRLFVFGDSYSQPVRRNVVSWPGLLDQSGRVGDVTNFAVGGATAIDDNNITFAMQVDAYEAQGQRPNGGDLTVTYFGYNDVDQLRDISTSIADYREQLDRLRSLGSTGNDQRLFVTLITDWGRSPGEEADRRIDVQRLNGQLQTLANNRSRVVAVDLFTVFERIFENPSDFGFSNVTSIGSGPNDDSSLFVDENHFTQRGQNLISQVYDYYLTRGWDFANSLAAGAAATARLSQDLDAGRVVALSEDDNGRIVALTAFGDHRDASGPHQEWKLDATPNLDTRMHAGVAQTPASGGVGVDLRYGPSSKIGIAFGDYSVASDYAHGGGSSRADLRSRSLSLSLDQELAGWQAHTRLSLAENDLAVRRQDRLLGRLDRARGESRSLDLRHRWARPLRAGAAWWSPWMDVSLSQQQIDGYRIDNAYLGETRYGDAVVRDLTAGVGLASHIDPIELNSLVDLDATLHLTGGLSLARSLHRDDLQVSVQESGLAAGRSQSEAIDREPIERMAVHLGADLATGGALDLRSAYDFHLDRTQGPAHVVRLDISYRF